MSNHAKKLYLDIIHIFLWGGSYLNFLVKTKKCIPSLYMNRIPSHIFNICLWKYSTYLHYALYNVIWILHASSLWKKNYAHIIIRRRIAPIAVYYLDTRSFRATPPPLYTKKIPCSRVNKRWLDSKPCLDAFFSIWTLSVCL